MKKYRFSIFLLVLALTFSLCAQPAAALEDPQPICGAAIIVDGDHGDVLYSFHGYDKMYPASITKVMTSLLALEAVAKGRLTLDQPITASTSAVALPEGSSSAGIKAGEILTVEELLYCALVASANEACNILAETVAGSVSAFVLMMNDKAAELGMEGTHFVNPHGLHDEDHYTTAYDISLMARAAMEYSTFRTIVATARHEVPATNMSDVRVLHNTNLFICGSITPGYTYSKAIGIKTGFTTPAGNCLVSAAVETDGRTYYCVVLKADSVVHEDGSRTRYSFDESERLLEWAFDSFKRVTLLGDGSDEVIRREVEVSLSDSTENFVIAQPVGTIEATVPSDFDPDKVEFDIELVDSVEAPVTQGDKLGTVSVIYDDVNYGTLDMVAADSVGRSDFLYYLKVVREYLDLWWVKALLVAGAALVLLFVVGVGIVLPRRRRRRRYSGSYRGGKRR